jgi:hypothetical protein
MVPTSTPRVWLPQPEPETRQWAEELSLRVVEQVGKEEVSIWYQESVDQVAWPG